MNRTFARFLASGILWLTAASCIAVSSRLRGMGSWLPDLPVDVRDWVATEIPLGAELRDRLGNPRDRSLVYRNFHGESVVVQVLAPSAFTGFGDPVDTVTEYRLLAESDRIPMGPSGYAAASAYESLRTPGLVLHGLRWIQTPSGTIYPFEPGSVSNPIVRLRRGYELLARDPRACVIHLTTTTSADGAGAGQVRRNLQGIAAAIVAKVSANGAASK